MSANRQLVLPEDIVEDIKAILVEAEFNARWVLIEAYHKIGQIILSLPGSTRENVQSLAKATNRGERLYFYAVKFAQTFETVEDLPEGKNISWNKIIRNHLTTPKEEEHHVHHLITVCTICGLRIEPGAYNQL